MGKQQGGFSLLEVMITIGLLISLSIALTSMLRSSLDIRDGLAQTSKVTHRLAYAMAKLTHDLQHAYVISEKDFARYGEKKTRVVKSIFKLDLGSSGDTLSMTTMSNVPLIRNAKQSDTTFVIYQMEEDKDFPGRRNLMRGQTKRVPENFKDEVKMEMLARHVKTFEVRAWRGGEWSKDRWDSRRREWRNRMPKMVQIVIEGFEDDPEDQSARALSTQDEPSLKFSTVVYMPNTLEFKDLRPSKSAIKWERL